MIVAQVDLADGHFALTIDGHASEPVCAAVTAAQQALLLWLDQFAQTCPNDLVIHLTNPSQEDTPP